MCKKFYSYVVHRLPSKDGTKQSMIFFIDHHGFGVGIPLFSGVKSFIWRHDIIQKDLFDMICLNDVKYKCKRF